MAPLGSRRSASETITLLEGPNAKPNGVRPLECCVEGAVVTEAIDVIDTGKPKMLEFGVADETAWNVGLSCGGTIRVFVEKVGS